MSEVVSGLDFEFWISEAYGSLSMSFEEGEVSLKYAGRWRTVTNRIIRVDLLCWHEWPLLDVRHPGSRNDVPIAIRFLVRLLLNLSS